MYSAKIGTAAELQVKERIHLHLRAEEYFTSEEGDYLR